MKVNGEVSLNNRSAGEKPNGKLLSVFQEHLKDATDGINLNGIAVSDAIELIGGGGVSARGQLRKTLQHFCRSGYAIFAYLVPAKEGNQYQYSVVNASAYSSTVKALGEKLKPLIVKEVIIPADKSKILKVQSGNWSKDSFLSKCFPNNTWKHKEVISIE